MSFFSKTKVAVVRGGKSDQYDTSLETGKNILAILREMPESYEPLDIFISRDGEWHQNGLAQKPHDTLRHADVVWNALHGPDGEAGQIQSLLSGMKIPFTGSSAVGSLLSANGEMARSVYKTRLLPTLAHELITKEDSSSDRLISIFRNYLPPIRIRPANMRSLAGISVARTFLELKDGVEKALDYSPKILVEEFIDGDGVSCTVIEEAKGEKIYALLPVYLDTVSNRDRFRTEERELVENMAKHAHEALGLRHYSSSEFLVTPKRKVYIVSTDSLPALHLESPVYRALDKTGWRSRDFVDHVLKLAM